MILDPSVEIAVFTDLDGTLLDHHDYSFGPVLPVMKSLRELHVPVMANTSKTRAEWLHMRSDFQNEEAFVVENGSAIIFPDGESVVFGERRERILEVLESFRSSYRFEGFSDWTVSGVMAATGLDEESAERSARREFSEPLIWQGGEDEKMTFREALNDAGLHTLEGGRFLHVLGQTDKGKALSYLRERDLAGSYIVALGDGQNDCAMLEAADLGIAIASPTGRRLEFPEGKNVIYSEAQGPLGWVETMAPILEKITPLKVS